eukprot:CAMPEP_0170568056 /NCGR_PEP_ID=MMETSP0211-20121228/80894_1 /TAXON_ID=311385 /ORGANISM="Pseudokeronopsis sp., Strain OXSARD2" /LENGTH=218 /DNA_ID=CAMNT_0010889723 /DNA_START=321 /DNA_END=977 /DNA_ORIENTATION=-
MTQGKASERLKLLEENQKNYKSIMDSTLQNTITKIQNKNYSCENKQQKKLKQQTSKSKNIRVDLSSKFEKMREGRVQADRNLNGKIKATIDRLEEKDRIRNVLVEQKELEHFKKIESNTVRFRDIQENYLKNQNNLRMNQSMRLNNYYKDMLIYKNVKEQKEKMMEKSKYQNTMREREVKMSLDPVSFITKYQPLNSGDMFRGKTKVQFKSIDLGKPS